MGAGDKGLIVSTSDAKYYHEYIAVHIFGMEPYIPREHTPVNKYTMGMAISYLPATFVGYVCSDIKGFDHDYGRNYIYQRLFYYFGFIYCFIGLLFLRLILKRWLDNLIIVIVLSVIFFGSNLYYYVRVEPMMSHATSFAFITGFLFYILKFFDKQTRMAALGIGLCIAFIVLIRPVNIIITVVPFIYFLAQKTPLSEKWSFIKKNILCWFIIAGCMVIAFIPQMVYWQHYTGKWMYYTYGQEKFIWYKPALLQVLFSFRKGWFIYTPIMIFIIPGAIICYKKNRPLFWSLLVFFLLNLYIISCWWCWWYGGGFGMRPMIDFYGLFAIWIGMFLQYLWKRPKPAFIGTICMIGFFVFLNLFQTRQARINVIHYDSMTYKEYKNVFLREAEKNKEWELLLDAPDYDKAKKGERFW